jgi:hypothetical protein
MAEKKEQTKENLAVQKNEFNEFKNIIYVIIFFILQIPIFSFQNKNPEFGTSKFKMEVRMILRIPIFSFQIKNPEFGTSKFKMEVPNHPPNLPNIL